MSRLTDKNITFAEKETLEMFRQQREQWQEFSIRMGRIENKLKKLEDLEEEIGCPLEVRCRVVTNSVIYDENGVEYKVVYTYMDYFDCEDPFDNDMGYCNLCEFSWVDYKETWWLKKDKSE